MTHNRRHPPLKKYSPRRNYSIPSWTKIASQQQEIPQVWKCLGTYPFPLKLGSCFLAEARTVCSTMQHVWKALNISMNPMPTRMTLSKCLTGRGEGDGDEVKLGGSMTVFVLRIFMNRCSNLNEFFCHGSFSKVIVSMKSSKTCLFCLYFAQENLKRVNWDSKIFSLHFTDEPKI